jgi:hypothetical protein
MTFKDKIDKILSVNQLGINSVSALEDAVKAGRGAINEFYNDNREPGRKTLKKIKSLEGLNEIWYDTGEEPVFHKNGTSVKKPADNKEKIHSHEEVYRTIVEGHTEYLLVPREVLKETQLVSTEQIKRTWEELAEKNKELAAKNQELERKNIQLDFYQNQFAKLLENLELSPKPPKPKEV